MRVTKESFEGVQNRLHKLHGGSVSVTMNSWLNKYSVTDRVEFKTDWAVTVFMANCNNIIYQEHFGSWAEVLAWVDRLEAPKEGPDQIVIIEKEAA